MQIRRLEVSNFRNLFKNTFDFSERINVVVGPNASGKTNIIEALFLLSTGKSFRARVEEEMVSYQAEVSRVKGRVVSKVSGGINLDVVLTRGRVSLDEFSQKIQIVEKKRLFVNGVQKRLVDFAGNFRTVLFHPQDLGLVTLSPFLRRKFLDTVLVQVDKEYRRALLSYEKGLRQRNKLLNKFKEERLSKSQLLFWDQLLIKNGNYISKKREEFVNFINVSPQISDFHFSIVYRKNAISQKRFDDYFDQEVNMKKTLIGPHLDDFELRIKNPKHKVSRDLSRFGSRGEQRLAVLWLKLSEIAFIKKITLDTPTLLLDDIFSELDSLNRSLIFKISKDQQTIITTSDPYYVEGLKEIEKINI